MTAIKAHFDGKAIVPDEPAEIPTNRPLRVTVEVVGEQATPASPAPRVFQPLNIQVDPKLSHAIALGSSNY